MTDPQYTPEYDEAYRTRLKELMFLFHDKDVTGGLEIEYIFFDDAELHKVEGPDGKQLCRYSRRKDPPGARHIDHFHVRFKLPKK